MPLSRTCGIRFQRYDLKEDIAIDRDQLNLTLLNDQQHRAILQAYDPKHQLYFQKLLVQL